MLLAPCIPGPEMQEGCCWAPQKTSEDEGCYSVCEREECGGIHVVDDQDLAVRLELWAWHSSCFRLKLHHGGLKLHGSRWSGGLPSTAALACCHPCSQGLQGAVPDDDDDDDEEFPVLALCCLRFFI